MTGKVTLKIHELSCKLVSKTRRERCREGRTVTAECGEKSEEKGGPVAVCAHFAFGSWWSLQT